MTKSNIEFIACCKSSIYLEGLQYVLNDDSNIKVKGIFTRHEDFFHFLEENPVPVALVCEELFTESEEAANRAKFRKHADTKFIALCKEFTPQSISKLVSANVAGIVYYEACKDELKRAITEVSNGKSYLSFNLATKISDTNRTNSAKKKSNSELDSYELLSRREKEVFILKISGYSEKEIGKKLFISEDTVKTHRKNVSFKTRTSSTAELVAFSIRCGIYQTVVLNKEIDLMSA